MTDRSALVRAIHAAGDGPALARAVAALDDHDRARTAALQADRETDLGATLAAQRLTPVPLHEHHTAATDWLLDAGADPGGGLEFRMAMIAEASTWYGGLDRAVREDREELAAQARGRARTLASAWAGRAPQAEQEFLRMVGYMHAEAASGLPQIDQVVDPNNQPSATPYPTQVFDNFAPDQDEFNGVETPAHQSGISSQQAPLIQQVMQQQSSGSGFGSGAERPDMHTTQFDASDGYAEVPLGPPGQIPAAPGGGPQGTSSPNPVAGTDQDEGAERRQALASWSAADPFGYRWPMTTEVEQPFHERCAGLHWPDEACGGRAHVASVAIGYSMNIDQAYRQGQCEAVGVREGMRAVASAASLAELGSHHNRVAQAWGASDRTADDTAVLHGFMAVVRPVLAERGVSAASKCEACRGGDCGSCPGTGCSCGHDGRKTAAKGLAGGGVTEHERETATHHLPGTDKFPVNGPADVQNAKHDIGRTSEPRDKVVRYINQMAEEYHVAPVGGHEKAASRAPSLARA